MKGLSAFFSGCVWAAAFVLTPAPGGYAFVSQTRAATTPRDNVLVFRKYRGADEVDERDHGGGGGSGGGGGGGDHGGGRGGSDKPHGSGSGKEQSSSGGGGKGGGDKGTPRDGNDRFNN